MKKKGYIKIKKNTINKEKNNLKPQLHPFNFGFALLKNYLAFDVIISHCFYTRTKQSDTILFITRRRKIHVPSFFILSFYFNYNTLISYDIKKKINRIIRLLIPYILWPIIIFVFCNLNSNYTKFKKLTSYDILIFQLLTGQGQDLFHFWYLFDLITTTLLFMGIIKLWRENHLFIINLLLIFSYFIQYSEYHKRIVPYFRGIEGLRRFIELLPFAVVGFTLKAFNILKILENYKFNTFIMCVFIFYLFIEYEIFIKIFGVSYHGIKINILSTCIVILFSLFPSNKITNKYVIHFLKFFTNHSGGIFYLHQLVHFFFKPYYKEIRDGTFNGVIQVYFISYIISMIGANVLCKTHLKFLFS